MLKKKPSHFVWKQSKEAQIPSAGAAVGGSVFFFLLFDGLRDRVTVGPSPLMELLKDLTSASGDIITNKL